MNLGGNSLGGRYGEDGVSVGFALCFGVSLPTNMDRSARNTLISFVRRRVVQWFSRARRHDVLEVRDAPQAVLTLTPRPPCRLTRGARVVVVLLATRTPAPTPAGLYGLSPPDTPRSITFF